MPTKKTFTREEAAKIVENKIIKAAGAMRNLINEGQTDYYTMMTNDRVWSWMNEARHVIERIEQ
jgi:hypothetical protein